MLSWPRSNREAGRGRERRKLRPKTGAEKAAAPPHLTSDSGAEGPLLAPSGVGEGEGGARFLPGAAPSDDVQSPVGGKKHSREATRSKRDQSLDHMTTEGQPRGCRLKGLIAILPVPFRLQFTASSPEGWKSKWIP